MLGKYNPLIDELGHIFLTIVCVVLGAGITPLTISQVIFLVATGLLIDFDHLLNPIIAKLLSIRGTIVPSKTQHGYTIKILHGFDLAFLFALLLYKLSGNVGLAACLFLILVVHEFWDFVVYDHQASELFLITRARKNFHPGTRPKHTGLIFKSETLPQ